SDRREKFFSLTISGKTKVKLIDETATDLLHRSLDNLTSAEQRHAESGLIAYAKALERVRLQSGFTSRPIKKDDNKEIAQIILEILTQEFNETEEEVLEMLPECKNLSQHYQLKSSKYFVI